MSTTRSVLLVLCLSLLSLPAQADAMRELLQQIVELRQQEQRRDQEREAAFLAARDRQAALTEDMEAQRSEAESRHEALLQQVEDNALKLEALRARVREEAGELSDLSGTLRQKAADLQDYLQASPAVLLYPEDNILLEQIQTSRGLADIEQIQSLWSAMARAIVDSAQIDRFQAQVLVADGSAQTMQVTRLGPFTQLAQGSFLEWVPETSQLVIPERQPSARFLAQVRDFESAATGVHAVPLDPSGGAVLRLLGRAPDPMERLQQGGVIGYLIIGLGVGGVLFAIWQWLSLTTVAQSIRRQRRDLGQPREDNPLGRVLLAAHGHSGKDPAQLERCLEEAVLAELPALERGRGLIKLLAAVAPMLGLMGTVTGMIATFQAISLFGAGDPRLMADGISEALVTTLLGLAVAVPLLFLHTLVAARGRELVQILDEQSAGLAARHLEASAVP